MLEEYFGNLKGNRTEILQNLEKLTIAALRARQANDFVTFKACCSVQYADKLIQQNNFTENKTLLCHTKVTELYFIGAIKKNNKPNLVWRAGTAETGAIIYTEIDDLANPPLLNWLRVEV